MSTNNCARDLMVPISEYPHIRDDVPVREAFAILKKNFDQGKGYRTILVLDGNNQLKGILTLRDMIRAVGPDFLKKESFGGGHGQYEGFQQEFPALTQIWQESFSEKCKEAAGKAVKESMKRFEDKVLADDTIAKCAYLMSVRDVVVLPVVDKERVVGVVRMVDIFREISDQVLP